MQVNFWYNIAKPLRLLFASYGLPLGEPAVLCGFNSSAANTMQATQSYK